MASWYADVMGGDYPGRPAVARVPSRRRRGVEWHDGAAIQREKVVSEATSDSISERVLMAFRLSRTGAKASRAYDLPAACCALYLFAHRGAVKSAATRLQLFFHRM